MQKTITLDQVATKLGLFYTELMDILDEERVELDDPAYPFPYSVDLAKFNKSPDTAIDYKIFVEIQKLLKIDVLPDRDPSQGFSPRNYERWKAYHERLNNWIDNWQTINKPIYESLLHSREGYFKKKGWIIPESFGDMCLWLHMHYNKNVGRRPEKYLTVAFKEEYFQQYHDAKRRPFPVDKRIKEVTNEHWALYYTYLIDSKELRIGNNARKTCNEFFGRLGMKGDDIYNKHSKLKNDKGRLSKMSEKGGAFLKKVKNMLTNDGYDKAAKLASDDMKTVFEKS